jgi:hypothetical protein
VNSLFFRPFRVRRAGFARHAGSAIAVSRFLHRVRKGFRPVRLPLLATILIATLLSSGCRSRPTALDPFLGRTTVPAPPTGAANVQPGATISLPPPASTLAPGTPTTIPPAGTPAPAGSIYSPPGGFTPNTSPPRVLSGNGAPPAASPPTQFVSSGNAIRIEQPSAGSTAASAAARPTISTNGAIDIMNLPVSRRSVSPPMNAAPQPSYPPGVGPESRTTTLPAAADSFGYSQNYSQLAGRLEYSPSDQRWFLRYVAPGNTPDRFGGVAWLAVQKASAGLKNGDFVVADGTFNAAAAVNGAPPIFTTTNVVLQRDRR